MFCVRDTGCGMTGDQLARLGRPFELVCSDAALARSTAGAGLGLPLVRALAEAHGGSLTLVSSAPDETVFEATLPRSRERAAGGPRV